MPDSYGFGYHGRMELRALRSFVWVADLGNITRASTELGIVQPALSRQIQSIEAELGTPLFTRLARGVQLTSAGRRFLEHARSILREVDQAKSELRVRPAAPRGRVALGISPTLAPVVAPGCYERVERHLPEVELAILEGFSPALLDRLVAGQLDVALLTNPPPARALRYTPLLAEPIAVVTSPSARGAPKGWTLEEVCRSRLIMTSGLRAIVEKQIHPLGRTLGSISEVDSVEAIRRILLRGRGMTLMPVSAFREDLESGQLGAAPIVDASVQRLLVMATATGDRLPGPVEEVASLVRQEILSLSEAGTFGLLPARLRARRV